MEVHSGYLYPIDRSLFFLIWAYFRYKQKIISGGDMLLTGVSNLHRDWVADPGFADIHYL